MESTYKRVETVSWYCRLVTAITFMMALITGFCIEKRDNVAEKVPSIVTSMKKSIYRLKRKISRRFGAVYHSRNLYVMNTSVI